MTAQKMVSERIAILRYVMIVGVVVLHTPPYVPVSEVGPGVFDFFKAFFQSAAFRATVPVLTLISGYLLFRSGLDQRWNELLRKKARTIVLPFCLFNFAVLAVTFAAQRTTALGMSYQLVPFDPAVWMDAAFGIDRNPINYPLNFLRDLIVVMAIAPLMGVMLRSWPWMGLVALAVIFLNNWDGVLVQRDIVPVMFYIGGLAATLKWNLLALDRYAAPCLAVFVALCAGVVYFQIGNTNVFRFIAPFLIWPAASLLHDTRLGRWLHTQSRISFFIFLAHAPLLMVLSSVHQRLGDAVPYPLYWCAAPVIVVAVLSGIYHGLSRHFPGLFALAIGAAPASRHRASLPLATSARL